MPAYEPLPPLLTLDEAEAQGVELVGTCDWGGCSDEAFGARWDKESGRYLTVCRSCARTTHSLRGAPSRVRRADGPRRA